VSYNQYIDSGFLTDLDMDTCVQTGKINRSYHSVLSAHPYYLTCIKLWSPHAKFLSSLCDPLPEAIVHFTHLLEDGALDEASRLLIAIERLLQLVGKRDVACTLSGLLAVYQNNIPMAKQLVKEAVASAPDVAEHHYLLGIVAAQERDVPACVDACSHAIALDPELGLAHAALALIYTLNQDWLLALTEARLAKNYLTDVRFYLTNLCLLSACWKQNLPTESTFLFDTVVSEEKAATDYPDVALSEVSWPDIPSVDRCFFVCCDVIYLLAHVQSLAWSLSEVSSCSSHLHIHVINPQFCVHAIIEEMQKRSGLSLSWSSERADPFTFGNLCVYASSVRFCRFAEFLEHCKQPAYILDADSLFRNDPQRLSFFDEVDIDLAVQYSSENPFWESCSAAGLFARPAPLALKYLTTVSDFIAHNLKMKRGLWFLDQIALAIAFDTKAESLKLSQLSSDVVADQSCNQNSVIWTLGLDKNACAEFANFKQALYDKYGDLRGFASIQLAPNQRVAASCLGPMLVNPHDMYIGPQILGNGVWAQEELILLRDYVHSGDVVIDVGANVGMHTLAFAHWVGETGLVHSFEPQRDVFNMLTTTLAINCWPQVVCHCKGVGSVLGNIFVPMVDAGKVNNFGALSLRTDSQPHAEIDVDRTHGEFVPLVTLDSLELDVCSLIKIDAEGMERDILDGAVRLIERCRPILYFEFHTDRQALLDFVYSHNYTAYLHDLSGSPNLLAFPCEKNIAIPRDLTLLASG